MVRINFLYDLNGILGSHIRYTYTISSSIIIFEFYLRISIHSVDRNICESHHVFHSFIHSSIHSIHSAENISRCNSRKNFPSIINKCYAYGIESITQHDFDTYPTIIANTNLHEFIPYRTILQ